STRPALFIVSGVLRDLDYDERVCGFKGTQFLVRAGPNSDGRCDYRWIAHQEAIGSATMRGMKPIIRIDCRRIVDWDSFHSNFAEALSFPDYYGRNMNACIDCVSDMSATTIELILSGKFCGR